jgi:hypothetical protein
MKRETGPKIATVANSPTLLIRGVVAPTAKLNRCAKREFDRLTKLLKHRGTLERVDIGAITDAARLKALLDVEHLKDEPSVRAIGTLTQAHRGRLRDIGLMLPSSRARYVAQEGNGRSQWAHLLGEAE